MQYIQRNKSKSEQTASADKYPQKYFKDKPCKWCSAAFTPTAPSELYCSDICKNTGLQDAYFKRVYGIGVLQYEKMLNEQSNVCKICSSEGFIMNKDRHKMKLVVDHCHSTGKVRGLLCHNCNRALGLFKDSKISLTKAIDYLNV